MLFRSLGKPLSASPLAFAAGYIKAIAKFNMCAAAKTKNRTGMPIFQCAPVTLSGYEEFGACNLNTLLMTRLGMKKPNVRLNDKKVRNQATKGSYPHLFGRVLAFSRKIPHKMYFLHFSRYWCFRIAEIVGLKARLAPC